MFVPLSTSMILTELFDSSERYSMNVNSNDKANYSFKTRDGDEVSVSFFKSQVNDAWEVGFDRTLFGDIMPVATDIVNSGDASKVFSTVMKILGDFISKHDPKALYFTAIKSQENRVKLYSKMIAKYAVKFGMKMEANPKEMHGVFVVFTLVKA